MRNAGRPKRSALEKDKKSVCSCPLKKRELEAANEEYCVSYRFEVENSGMGR